MTTALPTTLLQLHPLVLENPADKLLHHQRKSALYFTAIIVSAIGALTIFGGLTAMYLGLLSQNSLSGWGMFGVMVTGIGCMAGVDYFTKKQVQEKPKIAWFQAVGQKLSRIQQWDTQEIQQFFTNHQLSVRPEATALLQQKNPASPLKGLLPLIACTQVTIDRRNHWDHNNSLQTKEIERLRTVPTTHPKLIKVYEFLQNDSANNKAFYEEQTHAYLQLLSNPVIC
jgi:hypothetical protein